MDKLILHVLRERNKYKQLIQTVPKDTLGTTTSSLLDWYGLYFAAYPNHTCVELDGLASFIRLRCPNASPEQLTVLMHLVEQMKAYTPPSSAVDGVVQTLYERSAAGKIQKLLIDYEDGGEIDLTYEVQKIAQDTRKSVGFGSVLDYEDVDPMQVIAEMQRDEGVRFRQLSISEHIKGLMPGHLVMIAGRVGRGKTTYLLDNLAYFMPQCAKLYPGRPILWLNNESKVRFGIPRLYQSVLGKTIDELASMDRADMEAKFIKATEGCRVIPKDIHKASMAQVEQIIEAWNPCMVVLDMVAHVRTSSSVAGNRTDLMESLWAEFRELAAIHNFIAIGTAQISDEGKNMLFPPDSAIKDSKTAVQGTLDLQIMIGSLDDPQFEAVRGVSIVKTKLQKPGKPQFLRSECQYDPARVRFIDS